MLAGRSNVRRPIVIPLYGNPLPQTGKRTDRGAGLFLRSAGALPWKKISAKKRADNKRGQ